MSIMLKPEILLIGVLLICGRINIVLTRNVQSFDFNTLLRQLETNEDHRNHRDKHALSKDQHTKQYSDDSTDIDNNSRFGILNNRDVVKLVNEATLDNDQANSHQHKGTDMVNYKDDKHSFDRFLSQLMTRFLYSNKNPNKRHKSNIPKKRVVHSNLLGGFNLEDINNDYDRDRNSEENSQIFVVLDPSVLQKSTSKIAIDELLRKIYNLSSVPKRSPKNIYRYRDMTAARRFKFDSKEANMRDSMEMDYKPKRLRSDRNSGRTAIPYISHRGDIYEREN